ncbi:lysine-specific histone demethylase 1A [Octopus bimaculoides]|uniref:Amine oxidase n=1 Tax=Octopus bimaculoides TaxID=37653 RepID=A0A0L8GPJ5_OCTBM|nr:lysine-specific histone demethylase 1A [Octopus bimaculoides]|eukprot:XP_014779148.1 PREDICTED: lysine-specific histone demethylase 1A-like [Octopus bimaculoides]
MVVSFTVLLLCLVWSHAVEGSKTDNGKRPQEVTTSLGSVVVVGAGVAGLAAARSLTNSGQWDVTVLEARKERYGGRVWTDRINFDRAKGLEADLGIVMFDDDDPENMLSEFLGPFEVSPKRIELKQLIDGNTNKVYRDLEFENLAQIHQQLLMAAVQTSSSPTKDVSLQEAIDNLYRLQPVFKETLPPNVFTTLTLARYNLAPKLISCRSLKSRFNLLPNTVIEEGFQEVLDRLVSGVELEEAPLNLEMNKVVSQIKIAQVDNTSKVLVRTKDRRQKKADAVIVAVPLGVLKASRIAFDPVLPVEKRVALNSLEVSSVNSVVFKFASIFWPRDTELFHFAVSDMSEIGLMTTWLNTGWLSRRKDPYLTTFIQGNTATKFGNYSDTQLKTIALERLTAMFHLKNLSKDAILSVTSSNWASDPFSQGLLSYPTIGMSQTQWDAVSKPICPHIYFANDYTDSTRFGTIQGAFRSGLRAAEHLMQGCRGNVPDPKMRYLKEPKGSRKRGHGKKQVRASVTVNRTKKEEL